MDISAKPFDRAWCDASIDRSNVPHLLATRNALECTVCHVAVYEAPTTSQSLLRLMRFVEEHRLCQTRQTGA